MYTCSTQIMRNAALHPASRHLQIKRVLKLLLKTLSTHGYPGQELHVHMYVHFQCFQLHIHLYLLIGIQ